MPIQKGQDLLKAKNVDIKALQRCIEVLHGESRYVKYAMLQGYRSEDDGSAALSEINSLIEGLTDKLKNRKKIQEAQIFKISCMLYF